MSFKESDLKRIANLARIKLQGDEFSHLQKDIARIVNFIEQLNEVDIEKVEPMAHPKSDRLHLCKDEVRPPIGHEGIKNSAGFDEGLIKVPKIIE